MDAPTRRIVRKRRADRCEYCRLPQDLSPLASLQIEHIIPRKHKGTDDLDNLALACKDCNLRLDRVTSVPSIQFKGEGFTKSIGK